MLPLDSDRPAMRLDVPATTGCSVVSRWPGCWRVEPGKVQARDRHPRIARGECASGRALFHAPRCVPHESQLITYEAAHRRYGAGQQRRARSAPIVCTDTPRRSRTQPLPWAARRANPHDRDSRSAHTLFATAVHRTGSRGRRPRLAAGPSTEQRARPNRRPACSPGVSPDRRHHCRGHALSLTSRRIAQPQTQKSPASLAEAGPSGLVRKG